MFAQFQQKFRQRLGDILIAGAIWVNDKVSSTLFAIGSDVTGGLPILSLTRDSGGNPVLTFASPNTTTASVSLQLVNGLLTYSASAANTTLNLGGLELAINGGAVLTGTNGKFGLAGNNAWTTLTFGFAGAQFIDSPAGTVRVQAPSAIASATTNLTGSAVLIRAGDGASGSAGAASGGNVQIGAGTKFGTGTAGQVQLGWDGTVTSRVTVRNTILGLNGYTSSTAAATTTQLSTAGDCGLHKNTTTNVVSLCFNDGGTIKSVALA
jgi:hypothetical protein